MNRKYCVIAVVATLAAAPALAADAETSVPDQRRIGLGVLTTGVIGAIVAGPTGAAAGVTLATLGAERYVVGKRANELQSHTTRLESERLDLLAERTGMKMRIDELGRALAHERELAGSAADIADLADGLELAVGFRTGSATPPESMIDGLEALALLVAAVPSLEVYLDGYADPRGGEQFNRNLSWARAAAIKERLLQAGIDRERIHVTGHGAISHEETAPDPDGWALQRRVSIRLESRAGRLAAKP